MNDPALSDTYRVVQDPGHCFQFEPLTAEGERRYLFSQMLDSYPQSREGAAKVPAFPPRVARLEHGSVLGLSFLAVTRDKTTCLNYFTHNPWNPDKVTNFEETANVDLVGPDLIRGRFDGIDRYDEDVLVGDHWNFGHWLYNHLARLALAAAAPRLKASPWSSAKISPRPTWNAWSAWAFPTRC